MDLDNSTMLYLATKAKVKHFSSGEIALRQGDRASKVYFIKRGFFKVVRSIQFRRVF